MSDSIILPLALKATESDRLFWNGCYFSVDAAFLFEKQIKDRAEANEYAQHASVILRLVPFEQLFRAKMRSALGATPALAHDNGTIHLTLSVDLFSLQVLGIVDMQPNKEQTGSEDQERKSLLQSLQTLFAESFRPHLEHPFVSLCPELKNKVSCQLPRGPSPEKRIPFQALYPYGSQIELSHNEQIFLLEDLYCTKPSCQCHEVTCIILTIDLQSGRETAHGGFVYNLEKKSFRRLAQFPNLNAKEWFKRFSSKSPFDLHFLLESRDELITQFYLSKK